MSASVIDTYLAQLPDAERAVLHHIREQVHATVPDAQEVITYGMPGFTYRGKYLVGFDAHQKHLALYPTAEPIEHLHGQLEGYSLSRGTVRFTLSKPLPDQLVRDLVLIRETSIDNQ